jgi:hypothetical protein
MILPSAISAFGSLALASRAKERDLLDASADMEEAIYRTMSFGTAHPLPPSEFYTSPRGRRVHAVDHQNGPPALPIRRSAKGEKGVAEVRARWGPQLRLRAGEAQDILDGGRAPELVPLRVVVHEGGDRAPGTTPGLVGPEVRIFPDLPPA